MVKIFLGAFAGSVEGLFAQEAALATTLSSSEFARRIQDEIVLWKKVVRERNIQPE